VTNLNDIVRFSRINTNGITLHVAEAGPVEGPPVFLLHGFPEFWYGWRNQIAPLAARGFHVIAPDQRGYNLSDKPKGIASYDLDALAADVVGLADHFDLRTFAVAGHDWDGSVGWWLAGQHPDRLQRLAVGGGPEHSAADKGASINPGTRLILPCILIQDGLSVGRPPADDSSMFPMVTQTAG
jgi:pimeloyl-ACP methyl ester carboxylesterase